MNLDVDGLKDTGVGRCLGVGGALGVSSSLVKLDNGSVKTVSVSSWKLSLSGSNTSDEVIQDFSASDWISSSKSANTSGLIVS